MNKQLVSVGFLPRLNLAEKAKKDGQKDEWKVVGNNGDYQTMLNLKTKCMIKVVNR